MFRKAFSLALTFGALVTSLFAAAPAIADGWWGRGSIKDRRAAVPVPAPAPIPDYAARWYLRGDLGLGFATADASEEGVLYGQNLYGPPPDTSNPFSTPRSWSDDDVETTFSYGGGLGYYWSPFFRTDITFEWRSKRDLKIRGTYSYTQESYDPDLGWQPTGSVVDGETSDVGKLNSGLVLFNAYFDLARGGALTPYIGAGVGFAVNKLQRNFSNRENVCNPETDLDPWQNSCLDSGAPYQRSAGDSTYDVSFAAALMAGVSYSITPVTMLDLNYRYLFISSSDIDLKINNNVKSNFSTGDTHEHQIRVGLRWNIQ